VILVACVSFERWTLYWQRTYFCATGGCQLLNKRGGKGALLMTPKILEAIRSTSAGFVGFFDLTRTAVLDTTVSIAFKPAAFIVSPDSVTV
jgi:hypothetical protein